MPLQKEGANLAFENDFSGFTPGEDAGTSNKGTVQSEYRAQAEGLTTQHALNEKRVGTFDSR
jgi:hypothetical protein